MAMEDRNLEAGTTLTARYKGGMHTAEVVQTEAGLRYRLEDGREFKSPSAAGSAIMGGNACNGWRFWSVAGEEPKPKKKAGKPKANPGNGLLSRLEDGRWFCNACMEPFHAPADVEPQGCPAGHSPEELG